jgi:hypothetical protein
LNHFDIVASRVLRGQQAVPGAGCAADAGDVPVPGAAAVGIHFDFHRLRRPHVGQLRLFEVRGHPDVAQRNDRHQVLAGLDILSHIDGAAANDTIDWGFDGGVLEIELRLVQRRLITLNLSAG